MSNHPYSDPIGSGLVQLTPTQRLMNADLYRHRSGSAMLPGSGEGANPLDFGGLGEVLASARQGSSGQDKDEDEPQEEPQPEAPERPMPVNDADHALARGGIYDLGDGRMTHLRPMTGPTQGSAGTFAATDDGASGL